MQQSLKKIITVQEFDIKMIRLLRVKKERMLELKKLQQLKEAVSTSVIGKEAEITDFKKQIRLGELQIKEIEEKMLKLEKQQASVKKMDEFNALTQEMTSLTKEKTSIECRLSDVTDKLTLEEDLLASLKEKLKEAEAGEDSVEKEIQESIKLINAEGEGLLEQRQEIIKDIDVDLFEIYERLLRNKKDRVVVPIEKRVCGGCHIVLTAQHENLVRKGDRLVFCEHCSRILFWQESDASSGSATVSVRRRRKIA